MREEEIVFVDEDTLTQEELEEEHDQLQKEMEDAI